VIVPAAPILTTNNLFGQVITDYIRLEHGEHSSRMQMQILGVTHAEKELISQYDGYIGLAPPKSADE
jgi:hypothetical protein